MIRLLRTRACTRCGGDLTLERDEYGAYVQCIQCGAVWNQVEPPRRPRDAAERRMVAPKAATLARR